MWCLNYFTCTQNCSLGSLIDDKVFIFETFYLNIFMIVDFIEIANYQKTTVSCALPFVDVYRGQSTTSTNGYTQ